MSHQSLIQEYLNEHNFRVMAAANGQEALYTARHEKPDLILLDIMMPGIDGLETTRRIRAMKDPYFKEIPIIALTANVMRGDRERTLAAGCDGYIQKPVDVDELPKQISRYLRK